MSLKKYIVGGWVRDKLLTELGHPMQSNDKDWVVTGATPEEMLKLKFVPVGNDFPVFLHPKTHEEYALASRFRAKLPWFRIAEETETMLRRMVESGEVDALVPERVTAEIRKALKETKPSVFFDELEANGFMGRVYPEWKQTDFSRSLLDSLATGRIDSEGKWLASAEAVRSVDFKSISASAADKSRIPALIEEASVRAINEVLDKLADQH